tara:strand:+ start:6415 stop:6651 length:237 start_codon:yes stop_codon:yes gene_type:complete
MILSLDNLANRYNCLPSYALEHATTFDLRVIDIYNRHARYQHDKMIAEQKGGTYTKPAAKLTNDQMLEMIQRARESKI